MTEPNSWLEIDEGIAVGAGGVEGAGHAQLTWPLLRPRMRPLRSLTSFSDIVAVVSKELVRTVDFW